MNAFVVLSSILAVANAGIVSVRPVGQGPSTVVRAPSHDSASIESHRLGGNFAYSTAEAHAYSVVTPQLSEATFPVAETTHVHEPAPIAHVQPAPIVETTYAAQPVFGEQAIYAEQPIVGPVAAHTQVHQPLLKTQRVVAPVAYAHGAQILDAGHIAAPAYGINAYNGINAYAPHGYALNAPVLAAAPAVHGAITA